MNKILKTTALMIILATIVFVGCKKDEETTTPETVTPTVTDNFKAKIDGVDYTTTTGKATLYSGVLMVQGNNANNTKSMIIYMVYDSIAVNKTFPIGENNTGINAKGYYKDSNIEPSTEFESTNDGLTTDKITITKFDAAGKTISGTFNFTAVDQDDPNVKKVITTGVFTDLKW
ncbi:MAG: hypothetical protein A2X12_03285 [Bacteroidetes bacterium GWE2_29_8]|nr:MAG: hypothetical protein A2X12_03285 [Bacteroidetes bacterium GWE2_29_8]OFY14138.1 MAG: hypothetical protein A2X02_02590 [Bacteroidetes bacterium GWF2_29_10]